MKHFLMLLIALYSTHAFSTNALAGDLKMNKTYTPNADIKQTRPDGYPFATFAGGCFWCVESEFRRLDGVLYTESGYAGKDKINVTYRDVSRGNTGFREVIQIVYDPAKISYEELVEYFLLKAHDPTQTDGQNVNIGFQYTSAIYTSDDVQLETTNKIIADLTSKGQFKKPIVTAVEPLLHYVKAEEYHQQYYEEYERKTGQKHINILIKERK
jgi:methionine-S-sulfoxide reductase